MTIFSFTEKKEKIFNYLPWFFFKKIWIQVKLNQWKKYRNHFIIHIKGVSNRTEARRLTNSEIIISRHSLPILKENEYYWNDIINYKVFTIDQRCLGTVIYLIRSKNNDILVVRNVLEICKKNIFIPFINKKIIKEINTKYKFIKVQWK